MVPVARTAVIASEVSQPIDVSHETTPGTFAPCTPNAARDMTMVGTEPRLPPRAMTPQIMKDKTVPTIATMVACQKLIPKPRIHAP